jgi:uncharacterized protein (TIGR03437 family)
MFPLIVIAAVLSSAASARTVPLAFEVNRGQAPTDVRFLARTSAYTLELKDGEAVISAAGREIGMRFAAVGARPRVEGREPLAAVANYYLGGDRAKWVEAAPLFQQVAYREIAPGVDLVFRAAGSQLEFDLIVAPGGRPEQFRLTYRGARHMRIDDDGALALESSAGEIRQLPPLVYQDGPTGRRNIAAHYLKAGANGIAFQLSSYDTSRTLIIDPKLLYWTYLGGSAGDGIASMVFDSVVPQNLYVVGNTASTNFPRAGSGSGSTLTGSQNLFVAKFNSTGGLVYSTYIGGSGSDQAYAIAVDAQQNVYITGNSTSTDFPNVPRAGLHPASGLFYAALDSTGKLSQSITIGGGTNDGGRGIAVGPSGSVYLVGQATARLQLPFNGHESTTSTYAGKMDAFLMQITPDFSFYLAYIGGSGDDFANRVVVDKFGSLYISGDTNSSDFPGPAGNKITPIPTTTGGPFIVKLTFNAATLTPTYLYSTYLGDQQLFQFSAGPFGLVVDVLGNAWVAGTTFGTGFVPSSDAYQRNFGGKFDASLVKLDPLGRVSYATYLGGSGGDAFYGLALAPDGTLVASGLTSSDDLRTTPNAVQSSHTTGASNGLLARFDATGQPLYVSYFGGSGADAGQAVAVDFNGSVWVAGQTASAGQATPGSAQTTLGGASDGFVAEFDLGLPVVPVVTGVVNGANFQPPIQNSSFITITGANLSKTTRPWLGPDFVNNTLPLGLDNVTVSVNGKLAAVCYISPTQINALAAPDTTTGVIPVVVTNTAGASQSFPVQLSAVSPAFFVLGVTGSSGNYYPAAVFTDGSFLGPVGLIPGVVTKPAKPGDTVMLYGTGFGATTPAVPFPAIFSGAAPLAGNLTLSIGGMPAMVSFAGISSNGLDQFNVVVPDVADGDQPLLATIGGASTQSNIVLSVKR